MKNKLYHLFFNAFLLAGSVYLSGAAQTLAAVQVPKMDFDKPALSSHQTLRHVLTELESKFRVHFTYKNSILDNKVAKPVTTRATEITAILDELLVPQGLKYRKIDNIYVIYAAEEKLNFKMIKHISHTAEQDNAVASNQVETLALPQVERLQSYLNPQEITVSGRVTGQDNEPMPGVSVSIKGTNKGTTTNPEGRYTLSGVPENGTLVFSSIGFVAEEVQVSNRAIIDVKLVADLQSLTEVVVVGYGTQKKASLTGAVASVSSKEVTALPVPSIESAIQGRVAGIQVTANGVPGENPIVRIRGIGSINYGSTPLYVVDGYPVGSLNDFDTRDIESIDVLKDASSAAIYGSRAANGVILVTTKKGSRDGKLHVSLDSYYGTQTAWRKLDLVNTEQYIQYGKALLGNAGSAFPDRWSQLNQETYPGSGVTFAQTNTDWQDAMFRNGAISQHTVSLNGGNEKSRFYASLGYYTVDGIYRGTNFQRGNFRFNSEHTISKIFTFGQTLTLARSSRISEANGGGRTQFKHIVNNIPYLPVYNPKEIGGYYGATNADGSDPENPVRIAEMDRSTPKATRILATAYLETKLASFLKYRFTTGVDYRSDRSISTSPIFTAGQFSRPTNQLSDTRGEYIGKLFTNQLTFDKSFGRHNVNLIAVAEQQFGTFENITATGAYPSNSINIITSSTLNQAVGGTKDETVILSYITRLNYDFGGKYLLSASIRRDGASVFAPGKKWGTFPAISAGWRISEEAFMKNVPFVSEFKVRGSYGLVGFNGLPNYSWQPTINSVSEYIFNGTIAQGNTFSRLGNKDLQWELTKMLNVGFDLGLFNNALTLSVDYYVRNTHKNSLILERALAPSLGYSLPTIENIGAIKNNGLDVQLGYSRNTGNFKWNVSGNVGLVNNVVTSLESPLLAGSNADYGGFDITKTEKNMPIQYLYGWSVDRIYQNQQEINADNEVAKQKKGPDAFYQYKETAPGDIRFKDINNDGIIDDNDRTKIGNILPKFSYGLNFGASYKNFDVTLFIQGVQGNDVYNGVKVLTQGMRRLFGTTTDVLNAWTPTNTNTDVPRAVSGDPNKNGLRTSDRFVEKGSYLRVKNLSLGYNVPKAFLSTWTKGTLSTARIYVSTQNLLTFTKYTGYDPEIGSRFNNALTSGIDYGQYPQARTIMGGIQLGF